MKSTEAKAVPPMELLRPLGIGSLASHGWKVAELSPVMDGTCVLTLVNERGRSHRVHICRNEGAPQGLVHTSRFDLVVMNGGQGDLPTEEGLAQAIATVAHVVAGNESSLTDSSLLAEFQSYEQRVKLFSGPADRKLL
ncbi:MAG: hypothetical protein HY270_24645 [Deltaproteobacteria bacterium]|nr:hypothetical protein [Deltaproteobacteria bacterium]